MVNTGIPNNSCIGDDMRRKGSDVVRVGALQANGEGGSPTHLVANWIKAIKDLHLDIWCISETRVSFLAKHNRHDERTIKPLPVANQI